MTGRLIAGLALSAGGFVAGCGDDPDPAEERAALVASLADDLVTETEGAIDDETAGCVAEALVDTVGEDELDRLAESVTDPEDGDELRQQVIDVFAACDALDPLLDRSG